MTVMCVQLLLASGANIESRTHDGWTPLHSAANWGNVHEVDELLDRGAKVNALTKGRQTPLHLAVANSQSHETISVLLSHPELDVTLRNKQGETARDLAMRTRFHTLFH
jgi:ankyrin repeat protein